MSWLEKRLNQVRAQLEAYWLGVYEVIPDERLARRLAFSGPLPPCHEFSFDRGNVGTAASRGLQKVISDVRNDPTYSQCFIDVQSECVLPMCEPSDETLSSSFFYYQRSRKSTPWGVIDCEADTRDFFTSSKTRILEEFRGSLLPFLRFAPKHREFFSRLDDAISELWISRQNLRKSDSWLGIYLLADDHLELGPYRGFETEHHLIPLSRGLCGAAIRQNQTLVVDDVRANSEYLACSLETRSEIVIPLRRRDGSLWGELDLDSTQLAAYTHDEQVFLETWAKTVLEPLAPGARSPLGKTL